MSEGRGWILMAKIKSQGIIGLGSGPHFALTLVTLTIQLISRWCTSLNEAVTAD